jgi:hypothetical protein
LKPFGLDKSGTPPAGDMSEFFFHCFDAVFLGIPGNVTLNGGALGAADRGTLQDFVDEILNQLAKRLDGKTVNGQRVTVQALTALRAGLTSLPFADMNIVATFDLNLTRDNMNFFTSLAAMVRAVRGGLRDQIDTARTHFTATSLIDVRGCRVAQDPEYIDAIGAFFGKPGARPTVTGPHFFQAYGQFAFDTLGNRAQVRTWLSAERRMHPPQRLRELLTKWAEIIRVKPLHTDFWMGILTGPAVRLVALTKDDVPKLFIQAPGIPQITDPDIRKSIRALADFFNVAPASVPPTPDMTSLNAAAPRVRSAAAALLASVTDQTGAARLQELYEKLRDIDQAESQSIVPDTPPTPLNATHIRDFQKGLLEYFDATPLAPLKRFMSAAATSLNEGDGLYYYMFFAGLPVFIFGRPEAQKNSLVVFTPHERVVLQSWYQCLWKDPLPDNRGDYRTARVTINPLTHTMPSHVGDDRRSIESICPLPRYGLCIRTRPLPADEVDGECGSLSNP